MIATALNQYTSRENNTFSVGGTVASAAANAKVVIAASLTTVAGRAGRHWGDNVAVNNISRPFCGSILFYSALPGGAAGEPRKGAEG